MNEALTEQLTAFNQIYKEMDEVYHSYASAHHISNTAFWILYSICVSQDAYTQRELCAEWRYSPQTVNSALKGLEKQGLVELVLAPGSRRNKQIRLTPAGKEAAEQIIAPLLRAEQNSFGGLSEEERELLLSITKKHIALLAAEVAKIKIDVIGGQCTVV